MTTRLYLPVTGTPPLASLAVNSNWEYSTSLARLPCASARGNTALTTYTYQPPTSSGTYQWVWRQWQSDILKYAYDWTTADTVSMVIGKCAETTTGGDAHLAYVVRVVSGDGSVIRGVIGLMHATSSEFPLIAAAATRIHNALITGATNFSSQAGDRIIIEIGLHLATPVVQNMQMRFGDPTANPPADFALTAGLTTDLVPWVQLSRTVEFGVPPINGSLAVTLDAIGLSVIGAVSVIGSLTKTLDDIVATITGAVDVKGDLSKTLDGITFEASGTVGDAEITGTLSITLDAIALNASGTVAVAGSLDKTLSGIGLSAIGAVSITSVLTKTLDGISLSAAGVISVFGISNITLDGIGISSTGAVSVSGGLTKTLDNISLAGAGVVTVTGTLTKTLDGIILSASGTVGGEIEITGTLDVVLDDLSIIAIGQVVISGNLNITLDNIILIAILKRNVIITVQETILWKKLKNIRNNPSSISRLSPPLDRRGK